MSDLDNKKKEIQAEVDGLQSDIDSRINSIKKQITETLSVTELVKKHPLESVGIATLIGFVLAFNTSSKSKTKEKVSSEHTIKDFLITEVKKQVLSKVIQKLTEKINLGD